MSDINSMESTQTTEVNNQSLQECVTDSVSSYFAQLGDAPAINVYDMVLSEIEVPLLKEVLKYARGNQSKAAIVLGLSRGTLRKKLKIYGMEGRIKDVISQ